MTKITIIHGNPKSLQTLTSIFEVGSTNMYPITIDQYSQGIYTLLESDLESGDIEVSINMLPYSNFIFPLTLEEGDVLSIRRQYAVSKGVVQLRGEIDA
jgi:hypothetical protein